MLKFILYFSILSFVIGLDNSKLNDTDNEPIDFLKVINDMDNESISYSKIENNMLHEIRSDNYTTSKINEEDKFTTNSYEEQYPTTKNTKYVESITASSVAGDVSTVFSNNQKTSNETEDPTEIIPASDDDNDNMKIPGLEDDVDLKFSSIKNESDIIKNVNRKEKTQLDVSDASIEEIKKLYNRFIRLKEEFAQLSFSSELSLVFSDQNNLIIPDEISTLKTMNCANEIDNFMTDNCQPNPNFDYNGCRNHTFKLAKDVSDLYDAGIKKNAVNRYFANFQLDLLKKRINSMRHDMFQNKIMIVELNRKKLKIMNEFNQNVLQISNQNARLENIIKTQENVIKKQSVNLFKYFKIDEDLKENERKLREISAVQNQLLKYGSELEECKKPTN